MKKILIVNNNLNIGGIQKSLLNLLNCVKDDYEISLLLFSKTGGLIEQIPKNVKVITPNGVYRVLGLAKNELKSNPFLFILKAFLIEYTKITSRRKAMNLLGLFQKKIIGYDCVISYSHLPGSKEFANGCGDFVLDKVECDNKICLIHCDYLNSGFMSNQNNLEYEEFNKIGCCSESVKDRFLIGSNLNENKVYTLRNFNDLNILSLANISPYKYDNNFINIIIVSRLSEEKGLDRAINALIKTKTNNIKYYIIGDGPMRPKLKKMCEHNDIIEKVIFLGEQTNPYRYMSKADYLLLPSIHEAAPMVYDEAKILGLKVITTKTTSSTELIGNRYGIICENSEKGIETALNDCIKQTIKRENNINNNLQISQFNCLVNNND